MEKDFRSVKPDYDQDVVNGVTEREYQAIFNFLEKENIKKVLDLAGGSGKLTIALQNKGYDAHLFDIADNMVDYAVSQGLSKAKAKSGDFFEENFETNYDCVILKSSMHEIPLSKMNELHAKVYAIINKNGWFMDFDVHQPDEEMANWFKKIVNIKDKIAGLDLLVKNRNFYTEKQIIDSLKENNFQNISVIHRFAYTLSAKKFEDMYWPGDKEKTKQFLLEIEPFVAVKPPAAKIKYDKNQNEFEMIMPAIIIVAKK